MPLTIEHLCKVYQDGKIALDDFNWDVGPGVHGLLGPNGAGKSTLLEILSLNLMPTSGRVLWNGADPQKRPQAFRRALGYLPQSYGCYPELKAHQLLAYLGRLSGLTGRRLRGRIDAVLDVVNLEAERRRKVKAMSGGMRQRLAIAQALLHEPEVLVVDEPTTGLDPGERVAFRNILFDLGKTCVVLLSTHIVKDVEFSCHEMTLLYGGMQRYTGRPADFIHRVEGRVLEMDVSIDDFQDFSKRHHVIAIREHPETITVRFIVGRDGDDAPMRGEGARSVTPNLEDAYVDFIRDCQRAQGEGGALDAEAV